MASFLSSPSYGSLPSVEAYLSRSRYQAATANIRSTYERPTMARNTPEHAVRRRIRSQAARPRSGAAARCPGGHGRTAADGGRPAGARSAGRKLTGRRRTGRKLTGRKLTGRKPAGT